MPRVHKDPVCCAATRCHVEVTPGMLMCREHWFMVPAATRRAIGAAYRSRQMTPYTDAVRAAVDHVDLERGVYRRPFETGTTSKAMARG